MQHRDTPDLSVSTYVATALVLLVLTGVVVWAGWFAPWAKQSTSVDIQMIAPPR